MERREAYEQKIILEEDTESDTKLTGLSFDTSRFQPQKAKRAVSKETALVNEIWRYFDKAVAFPRLMNIVKTKGYQFTYECFNEVKKGDARNPASLFLWKIKNCRIDLKEV